MQCAYIAFFASLEMYTLADYTSEFWLYHYEWLFLFEFLFCLFCSFSNVFLFFFFFFLMIRPPPSSPLFPSTTPSRSLPARPLLRARGRGRRPPRRRRVRRAPCGQRKVPRARVLLPRPPGRRSFRALGVGRRRRRRDRKSTRLNSSH